MKMNKRVLLVLFSLILCFVLGLSLTACGDDECTHEFGEWTQTKAPGCETAGEKTRVCSLCEATEKDTVPAVGHAYGDGAFSFTEVTDGYTAEATFSCSGCSNSQKVTATVSAVKTDATCYAEGKIVYTAKATFGGKESTGTKTVSLPITHRYDKGWSYDENGHSHTCECGAHLPYTPHNPGVAVKENVVAPGCTTEGSYNEVVYCTDCGYKISTTPKTTPAAHPYEAAYTWVEITDGYQVTVSFVCTADSTHTHSATATVTSVKTDYTCQADGSIVYTATVTVDGVVYTDTKTVILATVHNYSNEYTSNETGHWYECTCGAKTTVVPHTPAAAVIEDEVAPSCNKDGSYNEVVYCSVCEYKISSTPKTKPATGQHTGGDPVIENDAGESSCSKKSSYDEVTYCTGCNTEMIRVTRLKDYAAHNLEVKSTVAASCEASGSQIKKCKNCDYTETATLVQLSHSYTDGECTVCHAKEASVGLSMTENTDSSTGNKYYTLSGLGSCTDTTVYIPAHIGGVPVTSIAADAFKNNTDIVAIYFSEAITEIGDNAFYGCTSLEKIVFSNTIVKIGKSAFYDCTSLKAINLPNSVQTVGMYAFKNCSSVTKIVIGEGVKTIGSGAFYGAVKLERFDFNAVNCTSAATIITGGGQQAGGFDVYIGENCTVIPDSMFYNSLSGQNNLVNKDLIKSINFPGNGKCTTIKANAFAAFFVPHTTVFIPEYVTVIGSQAFGGSISWTQSGGTNPGEYVYYQDVMLCLEAETVPAGYEYSSTLWNYSGLGLNYGGTYSTVYNPFCTGATRTMGVTDGGCYWVLKSDGTVCVYDIADGKTELIIPRKINGCSVSEIAYFAFTAEYDITKVVIPEDVTKIGHNAFGMLSSLETFEYRAIDAKINKYYNNTPSLFWYNRYFNITINFIIGKDVKTIPDRFAYISSNIAGANVIFENGSACEVIGEYAFYRYFQTFVLPGSIKTVNYSAFNSIGSLYYGGTPQDWAKIDIKSSNTGLTGSKRYYYNESPDQEGLWWKYVDGVPTPVSFVPSPDNRVSVGLSYKLSTDGKYYTVSGIGNCTDTEIIVPSTYNYLPVMGISASAFYNQSQITSVKLPAGMTIIENSAFYGTAFYNNTDNWTDGALYIGSYLIATNKDTIASEYTVKDGTTLIGESAFYSNTTVVTVTLPDSVKYISARAFESATNLVTVNFPKSYDYLGKNAFYNCQKLNCKIVFPENQDTVYEMTFRYCYALTEIVIPEGYVKIEANVFENCTAITTLTLPTTLKNLGTDCFRKLSSLKSIKIPNGVDYLPQGIFKDCYSLEVIEIPFLGQYASSTSSQYATLAYLFSGTSSDNRTVSVYQYYNDSYPTSSSYRTSAYIPKSLHTVKIARGYVGNAAFQGCTMIKNVILPETLQSIGSRAFSGCTSLMRLTVPASVTSISNKETFKDCTSLLEIQNLSTLDIVKGADTFGGIAKYAVRVYGADGESGYVTTEDGFSFFDGGDNVVLIGYTGGATEITLPANYKGKPYGIGSRAFYGMSSITSIIIPANITSIGDSAFYGCEALAIEITIPASQTVIGDYTFYNCKAITKINLHAGVTQIGAYAFYGCTSLDTLTLHEGVTVIGGYAFYNCVKFDAITIPSTVSQIGDYAFYGLKNVKTLNYNAVSVSLATFGNGLIFKDLGAAVDEGVKITIGKGVTTLPRYIFDSTSVTEVTFENGSALETISQYAFNNCAKLTAITLPVGLKTIEDYAFCGCVLVTEFIVPDSVTTIGTRVFSNCTALRKLVIGANTSYNPDQMLVGCISIEELTVPYVGLSKTSTSSSEYNLFGAMFGTSSLNGTYSVYQKYGTGTYNRITTYIPTSLTKVTVLGGRLNYGAFQNVTKLEVLTLGKDVTYFGTDAFLNCTGLKTVNYLGTIENWLGAEFAGKTANPMNVGAAFYLNGALLTTVTIPESVSTIKAYAFVGNSKITKVMLHDGVTSIGSSAFENCFKLAEVYNESGLTITKGGTDNGYVGAYALIIYNDLDAESGLIETNDGYVFAFDGTDYTLIGYAGDATSIILPEGYNGKSYAIGAYAFYGNQKLVSITVKSGVTSIGAKAFGNCTELTTIYIGSSVTYIGADIMFGCGKISDITVPFVGESDKATTDTNRYPFGYFFGTTSFPGATDSTSQTYYGSSASSTTSNWYYIPASVTKVTVLGGIIHYGAFYGINKATYEVVLGDGVTSIEKYGFYNTDGLTNISIGSGVTYIGVRAFEDCDGLTYFNVGSGVKTIDEYAFYGCSYIATVVIGENVEYINYRAFYYCNALKTVYNLSDLDISKGSTSYGYVANYATNVYNSLEEGNN